jgi:hypothetical protein
VARATQGSEVLNSIRLFDVTFKKAKCFNVVNVKRSAKFSLVFLAVLTRKIISQKNRTASFAPCVPVCATVTTATAPHRVIFFGPFVRLRFRTAFHRAVFHPLSVATGNYKGLVAFFTSDSRRHSSLSALHRAEPTISSVTLAFEPYKWGIASFAHKLFSGFFVLFPANVRAIFSLSIGNSRGLHKHRFATILAKFFNSRRILTGHQKYPFGVASSVVCSNAGTSFSLSFPPLFNKIFEQLLAA